MYSWSKKIENWCSYAWMGLYPAMATISFGWKYLNSKPNATNNCITYSLLDLRDAAERRSWQWFRPNHIIDILLARF